VNEDERVTSNKRKQRNGSFALDTFRWRGGGDLREQYGQKILKRLQFDSVRMPSFCPIIFFNIFFVLIDVPLECK
jgi:hypothetical protein